MTAEQLAQALGDPDPSLFEGYGPPYVLDTGMHLVLCTRQQPSNLVTDFTDLAIIPENTDKVTLMQTLLSLEIEFEVTE